MVNNIQYPANYETNYSEKENSNYPKGENNRKKSLSNSRGNKSSSNLKEFGKETSKNNQNEENSTFGFYKVNYLIL